MVKLGKRLEIRIERALLQSCIPVLALLVFQEKSTALLIMLAIHTHTYDIWTLRPIITSPAHLHMQIDVYGLSLAPIH